MGVLRAGVHLELAPELLLGERGLRQHAEYGLLDDPVGVLGEQIARRRKALVAHVAGVAEIHLVGQLPASQLDLGSVDDHHEIAPVHVGRVGRLVLAANELGHAASEPSEGNIFRIDQVPVVGDVRRCGGKCLHRLRCLELWTGPN